MSVDEHTLTSGKVISIHVSEDGEPEKITWPISVGVGTIEAELTENEAYEIVEKLDDTDSDD